MIPLTDLTRPWDRLGRVVLPHATFSGHLPELGPDAYLHVTFAPATDDEIRRARAQLAVWTADIEAAYRVHNGGFLFEARPDVIRWYGLNAPDQPVVRLGGLETVLPYSIHEHQPPPSARVTVLGSYGADRSRVCHDGSRVFRCEDGDWRRPLCTWSSVEEWLVSEFRRLSALFDTQGRLKVDYDDTLPPRVTS